MRAVIDTSYLVEFLIKPFNEGFRWVFDADLIAPDLLVYELHNVLLKALKIGQDDLNKFQKILINLNLKYINIAGDEEKIYRLAFKHSLSFYNASYLWLAVKNNLPLATIDRQILKIAECKFISTGTV
ncbi:MAG: type II toxin-antitoxin system VapC family toxin [Holosporales bacterium]|jgi:predicted nucleic acid-binding protein|nr:type II toxin-antitoxin system VapC family toxin [Holosporales bacterium]